MFTGACCFAGNRSPMLERYLQVATGDKMKLGSPSSATSALLDRGLCVLSPAIGLGTVCRLKLHLSGMRLGT
jgi:hypothetical protein